MFIFASSSRDSMQPSTPTAPRRNANRYTRSSTTSVTQLLSDSCSSLLQRLTSRVRGPSSATERGLHLGAASSTAGAGALVSASRHHQHHHPSNGSGGSRDGAGHHRQHRQQPQPQQQQHREDGGGSLLGNARSRIEEKYSAILERKPSFLGGSRQNLRQREREREPSPYVREERTLEPSVRRSVLKSPSTILLSEKAYPYVSPARREKTPCGHERRTHHPRRNAEGRASG